ncbi:MAG: nucleotidyltransferase domain-containing protein [Armatimonadetes bacterium]|nr:nucleotidyltransferase domain-containing protein [Armatimonadota bacterium]
MVSVESIKELSRRIVEEYRPERVVLFGSYAHGTPTVDSDVDLLIIMPFEGKSVYKSVEMRLKLRPLFPVDLIIRTPESVKQRLEMGDGFMREILTTGKVLYESDHR